MRAAVTTVVALLLGSASLAAAKRRSVEKEGDDNLCVVEERGVIYSPTRGSRNKQVAAHGFSFEFPVKNCREPSATCNSFRLFGAKETLFKRSMQSETSMRGEMRTCKCTLNTELTGATWEDGEAGFVEEEMVSFSQRLAVRKKPSTNWDWCSKNACWHKYSRTVLVKRRELEKSSKTETAEYIMAPDTYLFTPSTFTQSCTRSENPVEKVTLHSPDVAAKISHAAAVAAKEAFGKATPHPEDAPEEEQKQAMKAVEDMVQKAAVAERVKLEEKEREREELLSEESEEEIECPDCKDENCDENGMCTDGCKPGRWGNSAKEGYCWKDCPPGCEGPCDETTGECRACIDGLTGRICDQPCHKRCLTCTQYGDPKAGSAGILKEHCTACRDDEPAMFSGGVSAGKCTCISDEPRDEEDLCVCPPTDDVMREPFMELNGGEKSCRFRCKDEYLGERLREVFTVGKHGSSACITNKLNIAVILGNEAAAEAKAAGCADNELCFEVDGGEKQCLRKDYVDYIRK